MPLFASLPENLIAFCEVLRRDHGFRIGAREVQDAARALEIVPLANERAVLLDVVDEQQMVRQVGTTAWWKQFGPRQPQQRCEGDDDGRCDQRSVAAQGRGGLVKHCRGKGARNANSRRQPRHHTCAHNVEPVGNDHSSCKRDDQR